MTAQLGHVHSINVSAGGVPKLPVPRVDVSEHGLAGDAQRNLRHHGGPARAVCLWSYEVICELQREGHPVRVGSTGENLTLSGVRWELVVPGARLQIGAHVLLEITSYATPCRTIWGSFALLRYGRISQKRHPGQSRVYARVLQGGQVATGAPVALHALEAAR